MWVVKLGGSLADHPALEQWLAAAQEGAGRVVLVPGGGPFADTVRQTQARWRFSEDAAHRMALRAMAQFGLFLCDRQPALAGAETVADIERLRRQRRVPVWLPGAAMDGAAAIPASWDVTADSLAAWLSQRLDAQRLLLVKAVAPATGELDRLQRDGLVDAALNGYLADAHYQTRVCAVTQVAAFRAALRGEESAGPGSVVTSAAGATAVPARAPS